MEGNWITANLQAALDFFNAMITFMYDLLTLNPVTYREGAIWKVAGGIYNGLLGTAISLGIIFICMGFIEDAGDFIQHKNAGPFFWTFIKMMFMSAILIYGRYILIWIFSIGKELIDDVVLENGIKNIMSATWAVIPDTIYSATNGLTLSSGIVFWVVTLLAALVIMVSCFTIMLTVYGRILKIYIHIAIAPLPLACYTSKATMQHFITFIRSFAAVILEGVFIIIVCLLFSAFANGFDIQNPIDNSLEGITWDKDEMTDEDKEALADAMEEHGNSETPTVEVSIGPNLNFSDPNAAQNAEIVWKYLGEMLFMFVLMAGLIKGADTEIKKMLGV